MEKSWNFVSQEKREPWYTNNWRCVEDTHTHIDLFVRQIILFNKWENARYQWKDIDILRYCSVYKDMKLACYDSGDPTSTAAFPTDSIYCEAYFTTITSSRK